MRATAGTAGPVRLWVTLPAVLTPDEEDEIRRAADDVHSQPARLDRLHRLLRDAYWRHRDDPDPPTQAYLAGLAGYTDRRVQQIVHGHDVDP